MSPSDFLTETELVQFGQYRAVLSKIVPLFRKWVDMSLPFQEHLDKAVEQQQWFDKIAEALEIK